MGENVKYLPFEMMDEWLPEPRDTPESWIVNDASGTPTLARIDDENKLFPGSPLIDGSVVKFCSLTDHGRATLALGREREWSVDRDMPREADAVCALDGWQVDSLGGSVEECATALFDHDAEPGEYRLSYYTWSAGEPYQFDASARRFTKMAEA